MALLLLGEGDSCVLRDAIREWKGIGWEDELYSVDNSDLDWGCQVSAGKIVGDQGKTDNVICLPTLQSELSQ